MTILWSVVVYSFVTPVKFDTKSSMETPMKAKHRRTMKARIDYMLESIEQILRIPQDARRYQWLRRGDNDEYALRNNDGTPVPVMSTGEGPPCFLLRLEELDITCDAQMEKEKEMFGSIHVRPKKYALPLLVAALVVLVLILMVGCSNASAPIVQDDRSVLVCTERGIEILRSEPGRWMVDSEGTWYDYRGRNKVKPSTIATCSTQKFETGREYETLAD
jgi:hypothetical protein